MIFKTKAPLTLYICLTFILISVFLQLNSFNIKNSENPHPISWDVYGYYLYLPASFIYNDLGLENDIWINETREKYQPSSTFYQVKDGQNNKKIIVYNCGYAFIYAPGFLFAHSIAPLVGYEQDGFSKPYQLGLLFTALLISIIGVIMLRKIVLLFFSDKVSVVIIACIFFGTNYFYQSIFDGLMPHNILFTINCFIVWYTIRWHKEQTMKNIFFVGLFIGIATLCRPTELIWLLIPLLWNVKNKEAFIRKIVFLFKNYLQLLALTGTILSILCIQLAYNKYASGMFFNINLHNEGFSFLSPYTYDFLFSYKKGWLVYTPLMTLGILGFYFLWKENKKIALAVSSFFIINLYVISSWECWWYATSFSQRPMVESYAIMALPLGYFINDVFKQKNIVKGLVSIGFVLFVSFNLFQTWQFKKGIIHGERMTKEYYWKVFGTTEKNESFNQFLSPDRYQNTFSEYNNYNANFNKKVVYFNSFENLESGFVDSTNVTGKKSLLLDSNTPFSPEFKDEYFNITSKSYVWVRASVWVYQTVPYTESNSCLVVSTEYKGKSIKYKSSNYESFNIKPFKWTQVHLDYITPNIIHKKDLIKIYFWNMGNKPVLIDDFKINIFEPKNDYR